MQSTRKNVSDMVPFMDFMEYATSKNFYTIVNGQLTQNFSCALSGDEIKWSYETYCNEAIDLSKDRIKLHESLYLLGGDIRKNIKVYNKSSNEIQDLVIRYIKKYKTYCFKYQCNWIQVALAT